MSASRLTFRRPAAEVAWQRQLRDRYAAEGVPPVPHLDLKRAVVRPVGRVLARQIILRYEWLGTMASTTRHYGIFFGPYCGGVTCVAVGSGHAGSNSPAHFGVRPREFAVLARGACVHWAPNGSNSRLLAWTVRLLRREGAARVLVAYADTDAGEIGTVYQACGWAYVGAPGAAKQVVAPSGRIFDERTVSTWARERRMGKGDLLRVLERHGWRVQRANAKHRYVCVLDRSDATLTSRIQAMRRPYPKRVPPGRAGVGSDTPTVRVGEGAAMRPHGSTHGGDTLTPGAAG